MKIPQSNRKKALFIVDAQPASITKRNRYAIDNIVRLINEINYDFYVEAIYHAEKGSLWEKQSNWTCPKDEKFHTVNEIKKALATKELLHVEKETKSVFKGIPPLLKKLKQKSIEEIQVVGFDTNDCIMATVLESFDLGFFTYVIEECSEASTTQENHNHAIALLRHLHLTNNSCKEKINFRKI